MLPLGILLVLGAPAGAPAVERVVDYRIQAEVDPRAHRLEGRLQLRFTNSTRAATGELHWHLYLNAFAHARSAFLRGSEGKMRDSAWKDGGYGRMELLALSSGSTDLLASAHHPAQSGTDEEDRTVLVTPLPQPLQPGESVELQARFRAALPRDFARAGYTRDFGMYAQWYPKLGVLEEGPAGQPRWVCHGYGANGEFYADYGRFQVELDLPVGYEVGASGWPVSEDRSDPGRVRRSFLLEPAHDFAFAVDPHFRVLTRRFVGTADVTAEERREAAALLGRPEEALALPDVEVRLLYQPEHQAYAERYLTAVFAAIRWFGLWYGPYPYPVLTIVDGPRGSDGAMGMEYPTLITGGSAWPVPDRVPIPEDVTVHEFGHQYWYGLVGTNETEEAWLDEGLNTYSTGKVLDRAYPPFTFAPPLLGFYLVPWFPSARLTQLEWLRVRNLNRLPVDPVAQPAWQYRSGRSYGYNVYGRAALLLSQLERELGPAVFARGLRAYAERHRFRHPRRADLIRTLEEVSGRPLAPFLERALTTDQHVDYAVSELKSRRRTPDEGWVDGRFVTRDQAEAAPPLPVFEHRVVLERLGGLTRPVPYRVRYADGSEERRVWDGEGRWSRVDWSSGQQAESVALYPEGEGLLDLDPLNDSRAREPSMRPAITWAAHTLAAAQALMSALGALF